MNQREMGVNRTVLKDNATGRSQVIFETRHTNVQFWFALLGQLLVVGVIVFGAVKFGVQYQAEAVVKEEVQAPYGVIFQSIQHCVSTELEPLIKQSIKVDVVQEEMRTDLKEIKDSLKEIAANGR